MNRRCLYCGYPWWGSAYCPTCRASNRYWASSVALWGRPKVAVLPLVKMTPEKEADRADTQRR